MEKTTTEMSRRGLLHRGGLAIAAAGFPFSTVGHGNPANSTVAQDASEPTSAAPPSDVMVKLSTYMAEAGKRALPDDVTEKAKEHILDTLAAMVSGVNLPPAQVALKFARAYGAEKVATMVGANVLCGPLEAAIANGMLAHSDETDDSHAPSHSHPGCAVVPRLWRQVSNSA